MLHSPAAATPAQKRDDGSAQQRTQLDILMRQTQQPLLLATL
jgi:hypothetical protein